MREKRAIASVEQACRMMHRHIYPIPITKVIGMPRGGAGLAYATWRK